VAVVGDAISTPPSAGRVQTVTRPSGGQASMALAIRLRMTWFSLAW
jgi:hypothetical protein